jgi:hypothetical protein
MDYQLVGLEIINKRVLQIIRTRQYEYFIVYINQNKLKHLNYILNNYKFMNYDIKNTSITDEYVSLLGVSYT